MCVSVWGGEGELWGQNCSEKFLVGKNINVYPFCSSINFSAATCMFWPTHSPASSDHLCQLVRKFISIRDLMSVIYSQCNVNGCNAKT